ncbi:MAG: FtsK/SpoIIIE domain-containing protein [Thiothrix sp.]|uniref:FtsK/SpoIIIE domain-containing protein n=1 Tax=Thiothrix sp. TaxID=1032 RepID=UPI0026166BFA|nr:FtsK/SpoIIIE domain-containing protein [Thiothrix sp.]MDD5395388.1 FtsK/SpoIIIE domain-containing protein [Thiothrix sp.]
MATLELGFITDAKRRRARASKLNAVTGSNPAVGAGDAQLSHKLAWVGHIRLPRISVRPEMLAGAGVGVAVGAGLYISWDAIAHAMEAVDAQLVAPDWYKPALSALGQASTIGLASGLYSLQWVIRTDMKRLSATIAYALLVVGASAPVLTVCGFNGGMVGQYVAGLLQAQGVAPAVIAASGTLLALFASLRSGNPLPKLAVLLDLAGGVVTGLLPEGREEPATNVQQASAPVANSADGDALKAKMREVLVARKLEYVDVQQVCVGPVLTTFMVKVPMDKDTKALDKETNKIATVFKASGEVAVIGHVRGTDCGAIEVPNAKRGTVSLSSLMQSPEWLAFAEPLPMLLGVDTFGNPKMLSLPNTIHLLVAGSTGMGKSIFMNALLLSMMSRSTPDMLRLHMVDPKQLEFGLYEGSPFVEGEIITDMGKVRPMLEGLIDEMERRYGLMKAKKVRNIAQYNAKSDAPLPYEVALFEEFADFVMLDRLLGKMTKVRDADGNEVVATQAEELIIRLAQKARAAGIHLLPTTQRPDKDVVTPLIRSNIPSRIAFKVMSDGDSSIILGKKGAENLLDKGDGYGLFPGSTELQRFHGPFVTEAEVEAAVAQQRRRWVDKAHP